MLFACAAAGWKGQEHVSRTGVEEKPRWGAVPLAVRRHVDEALGAQVARAARVFGGYSPTPTFRLQLADGSRAFFKGTIHNANPFATRALVAEQHVYRELGTLIGPWAPRFLGTFQEEEWNVLLLEDVGPKTVPPWTSTFAHRIAHTYAEFHASTLGRELPDWLPRSRQSLARVSWQQVAEDSDDLVEVAALARESSDEALAWLGAAYPILAAAESSAADVPGPYALLHLDTRSDNLRFVHGRLVLFDWPFAEVGRPELDLAAFAQSVAVENGPSPEQFVAWYAERLPIGADALDAMVAWLAAFFAGLAWLDDIPGLPRLRPFQRRQLAVVLAWAARRLRLPDPSWVRAIAW
jgi:thiamine kinase-like enzyme